MQEDREVRVRHDTADDRPLSEIVEQILHDLQQIFHEEVRLAASEMKEKARQSTKAGIFLGGAAFLGLLATLCLVTTCIVALAIVLPLWLAALLMAVVLGIGAGGAFLLGRMALEEVDTVPQRTVETLRDLTDWARTRTR